MWYFVQLLQHGRAQVVATTLALPSFLALNPTPRGENLDESSTARHFPIIRVLLRKEVSCEPRAEQQWPDFFSKQTVALHVTAQ